MKTKITYRVTVYPKTEKAQAFSFKTKEKYLDFINCLKDDVSYEVVERITTERVIKRKAAKR